MAKLGNLRMAAERYHVSILTHESTHIPFEQTIADLLTQFFVGNSARLRTSILVEGMHILDLADRGDTEDTDTDTETGSETLHTDKAKRRKVNKNSLVLVDYENVQGVTGYNAKMHQQYHYLKEDVPSTAQFQGRGRCADIIISLSHGWVMHRDAQNPDVATCESGLCFRCEGRGQVLNTDTMVFAKQYPLRQSNSVTLHSIIQGCELAILLCCSGQQVLEHYLEHVNTLQHDTSQVLSFPYILIPCAEFVNTFSCEIYMVLLINILESFSDSADKLFPHMCAAILRIMQIVKLFDGDHISF
jgi:hypothetical protein